MRPTADFALVRRALLTIAALAAFAMSCVAADPMPTPGRPDRSRILLSSSKVARDNGPVDLIGIIGLANATELEGEVLVRQPLSGTLVVSKVASDGSFATVFTGTAGDRVVLTFREDPAGPESEPVELDILAFDNARSPETPADAEAVGSPNAPLLASTGPQATAPNGQGQVTVTGENLTAGHVVAIGNMRTGDVAEVTVAADGRFTANLAAASGDTLVVIVRDPVTGSTSGLASISVGTD